MQPNSPVVRVLLEFADGTSKELVGPQADAWMEDLNSITAFHHVRTGNSAMSSDYQWRTPTNQTDPQ